MERFLKRVSMALLLIMSTAMPVHSLEVVGFRTEPAAPIAGEIFSITLLLDFVGCGVTIEDLAIVGSAIQIVGAGGPPPDGGCGGVVLRDVELDVEAGPLVSGSYDLEVSFLARRDGTSLGSLSGRIMVEEALAIPSLSLIGRLVTVLLLALLGLRRVAA